MHKRRLREKDTIHDHILQNYDEKEEEKKEKTPKKIEESEDDSDSISSDSEDGKVSGFESVIIRKKHYFAKIKKRNRQKRSKEMHRRRIEILVKFILYVVSNIINILAVFNYIIQTYFDNLKDEVSIHTSRVLQTIEVSFTFYFFLEYFLFLFHTNKHFLKHVFSLESFIDLITIVPSICSFFITNLGLKFNFIRVFRIFRVFRILRIYKSLRMIQYESVQDEEGDLNNQNLKFDPIKLQFFTILVVLVCVFFIGAGLVLGIQDLIPGSFSMSNMNFFDSIYFMIVTYCTLGYGDIIPTHVVSRFLIIIGLFCLIVIVSNQLSKLANLLSVWGPGIRTYSGTGHIIVIADSTINLRIFLSTIRRYYDDDVILISSDISELPSREHPYNRVQLMFIKSIDFEILERANTKKANVIFIFSNKSLVFTDQKEKVTDFFILKINRYFSEIPVYVQTLYSERSFSKQSMQTTKKHKLLKFKKIIPILRIKSLIISKSLFNPGFATFSQNLLFNDYEIPYNYDSYSIIMSNYLLGCENKINILALPEYFIGMEFYDVCYLLYFRSIKNYFTELSASDNKEANRPVLLIGVIEQKKFYDKDDIQIYPSRFTIRKNIMGIFISYNEGDYLKKLLLSFDVKKGKELRGSNTLKTKVKKEIRNFEKRNSQYYGQDDDQSPTRRNNILGEGHTNIFRKKSTFLSRVSGLFKSDDDEFKSSKSNKIPSEEFKTQKSKCIEDILSTNKFADIENNNGHVSSEAVSPVSHNINFIVSEPDSKKDASSFLRRASRFLVSRMNLNLIGDSSEQYKDANTRGNIQLLQELEENHVDKTKLLLDKMATKRYSSTNDLLLTNKYNNDNFVDSRIFDIEKLDVSDFLSGHILLIGYQDNLGKLLKLIFNHYQNKEVGIISKNLEVEHDIIKLMRQFKYLIYLKGDASNPFNLLHVGLNKAHSVILLTENVYTKTNEDMNSILAFKSIDYFFNIDLIIELWDDRSIRFLGYQPLNKDSKVTTNEFLHPIFMSGKVIYLSHLEKIIAMSYINEYIVEAWIRLISLGYTSASNNIGFKTLSNNRGKEGFPVIVTIDIPEGYINKEYYTLLNDMLLLDPPALCLGIYIQSPLEYLNLQSQGNVARYTRRMTNKIKIQTSHKKKISNWELLDKVEQGYKDNLKVLRDVSYNDKAILDYVDINKSHLPIFITNPAPGFIINEHCKVQVLYHYTPSDNLYKSTKEKPSKNAYSYKSVHEHNSTSGLFDNAKTKLASSQDNFFLYYDILKDKLKNNYSDAYKLIEKKKQEVHKFMKQQSKT